MADVILIFPATGIDVKGISTYLPLSVLCLAAPLEQEGYKVKIIDQRIDKDWKITLAKEMKSQPLCVGISAMTGTQIRGGLDAAKLIRRASQDTPIVWGGTHPSLLPKQTLANKHVDIVVVGEGERIFLDLVRALEDECPLNEVKGIYFKSRGEVCCVLPSHDLFDLDTLPPLPYHLIDVNDYLSFPNSDKSSLLHFSSRGCPHSCTYCYNQVYSQRKWRYKSPERLVEELKTLKFFGAETITLADDDFFANKDRVKHICHLLKKEPLHMNLNVSCRIDYILQFDEGYLAMLKASGIDTFYIGVESGSFKILNMLNKGINVSDILLANRKLQKTKISSYYSFMAGFPSESLEDMKKTLNLMLRLTEENKFAHILPTKAYVPYPGTDLFVACSEYGFQGLSSLDGWSEFQWNESHATWLNKKDRDFIEKMSNLTMFLDGKSLKELKGIRNNRLLTGIASVYTKIAKYRINNNMYQFCPELAFVRFAKKHVLQSGAQ